MYKGSDTEATDRQISEHVDRKPSAVPIDERIDLAATHAKYDRTNVAERGLWNRAGLVDDITNAGLLNRFDSHEDTQTFKPHHTRTSRLDTSGSKRIDTTANIKRGESKNSEAVVSQKEGNATVGDDARAIDSAASPWEAWQQLGTREQLGSRERERPGTRARLGNGSGPQLTSYLTTTSTLAPTSTLTTITTSTTTTTKTFHVSTL